MTFELAALFANCSGTAVSDDEALDAELRSLVETGHAAWPGVKLELAAFVRHVADRTAGDRNALHSIHAADIFLACACVEGHAAAVEAFHRIHLARVPEFLSGMRPTPDFCDDVRQILSEKLLVATGSSPPKIGEYSGRGSLAAWLRVAAVRTALNLRQQRRDEPEETGEAVVRILGTGGDPELDYIRQRYANEFTNALRAAFAALSPDQRLVLRLHATQGLTGEQIANTLQIHRATVVRWITRAREEILREATKHLRGHLRISPSELDSLVALVRSHVDLSLSQLLVTPEP